MLSKSYDAKKAEEKWQRFWEKEGIYKFDPASKKKIYSVDTPPPTVSGKMHLGHAFSYAQQDFVIRYKRMQGFNVFYPFGTDDNGLATERLIESEKGVRANRMKREDFVKLCLKTLEKELRPRYIVDWKRIGVSCDWSIFYTTINDHCKRISQESFIDLYKKKRIYRKRAPFMWCPECQTAIAQVELKDKEKDSEFVYMKFDTSLGKKITIATTRPELMAACVAVHVHPNDKRYKEFIGKKVKIPFFNREVKVYANKDVDMSFGSGAVYHCTFGDMDDAEWIEKLKIKPIEVMNKDGTLNEKGGKYRGMGSAEAREAVIRDLEKENRIEKIEKIRHVVNTHERCDTEIEILMTDQWFIKYMDLKKKFLDAGNKLNWHPKYMKNRYDNWVKGLKWDWCISRQRFFGVPFPVWYCSKCKEVILAEEKDLPVDPLKDKPNKKCKCGSNKVIPEKDVLDTWATSSLTPQIAARLFPKMFNKLYPMNLRPQAHDIISFWLFNTVVKSQLHNNINPWKDVMISGWALDPHGKKMSKSKGNVIEPQEMIGKYCADALRFWAASSKLGEDLPFQEKELVAGQKMIIKLWNASRFSFMHLDDFNGEKVKLDFMDKWLLSKLNKIIEKCTKSFERYDYSVTKNEIENFFWNVFCDYYLEIVKDRLYNPDKRGKESRRSAQFCLYYSLFSILKLIGPIMPHITEEIYNGFYAKREKVKSIHNCEWPKVDKKMIDDNVEKMGDEVIEIIKKVRQFKTKHNKSLKMPVKLAIDKKFKDESLLEDLKAVCVAELSFGKFKVEF